MNSRLSENVKLAAESILSHKLRSLLTLLGLIIGTTTVIAVSSIITGLNAQVVELLESFGTNSAFIFKFDPGIRVGRLSREERMRKPLTFEDGVAIRQACPDVAKVAIMGLKLFGTDTARYGREEILGAVLRGATVEVEQVMNAAVSDGRFFTEGENQHRAQVCVIGAAVAEKLFPHIDPVGKRIEVGGRTFTVLGVLEKRKQGIVGDEGADRVIFIPYYTFRKIYPQLDEHLIAIQARPGRLQAAIDQATDVLRRRRGVRYDQPNNFGISTAESIIEQFHAITGIIALAMVVISSIGLLVGGVGVMNIMLVSVVERTHEIGIRKAVGARRSDIAWQFLSEAMALAAAGGTIGILLGSFLSFIVRKIAPTFPSAVPWWSVAAGLAVSLAVGLIFGLWPALRAARLDPVEALRYE